VFEHLRDPVSVLTTLAAKLKEGGRIFIDTPKQSWIYPAAKAVSKSLYTKLLRGTVSQAHLQIWSRKAFRVAVQRAGLGVEKYQEITELTMPVGYYLHNMGIDGAFLKLAAKLAFSSAQLLFRNKIICVLKRA